MFSLTPAPSLPDGVTDKTWVAPVASRPCVAGTVDARYHIILPSDERPLAAGDFHVVSAKYTYGPAPSAGVTSSSLIVRDVRTGSVIAQLDEAGAFGTHVGLTSDTVYFIRRPDVSKMLMGVYALSLGDGSVRTLLTPDAGRDQLVMSPSGRTLAVGLLDGGTEVLDLASNAVTELRGTAGSPFFVSDSQLITTDGTYHLYAYDLQTQQLQWTISGIMAGYGYMTSDGTKLVLRTGYSPILVGERADLPAEATNPAIRVIDTATGAVSVLAQWNYGDVSAYLMPDASNDQVAVIVLDGWPRADGFPIAVLNLNTGALTQNALVVSVPSH